MTSSFRRTKRRWKSSGRSPWTRDAPEWSDDNWSRARPAVEVDPELVAYSRRTRGKQKAPTKVPVYIRLDADIVAHFRQGGRGWQTRLNDALRKSVIGL